MTVWTTFGGTPASAKSAPEVCRSGTITTFVGRVSRLRAELFGEPCGTRRVDAADGLPGRSGKLGGRIRMAVGRRPGGATAVDRSGQGLPGTALIAATMNARCSAAALFELRGAVEFYEQQQHGLGERF